MLNICRVAALTALLSAAPVFAASVAEEAQGLMNKGNPTEALRKLEAHLAKNPQDAEARFTRGLALVRLNRAEDAIRVFADLTRDYPQLPEPYNNLAVLYAQQGEYERARDALEAALATHPSYATAHENLGDIYAALAGAAYNRALMLDQSNTLVRRKLSLINQLDSAPAETAVAAATPAQPAEKTPAAAAAPATAETPAMAMSAPAEPAATLDAAGAAGINNAVQAWAKAWSSQDLDAYFAAYAPEFTPEGGLSRAAWETQRRDRVSRPSRISVKVANPEITALAAGRARVAFTQEYESESFSDSVAKVLEMQRVAGNWKILREYTR